MLVLSEEGKKNETVKRSIKKNTEIIDKRENKSRE